MNSFTYIVRERRLYGMNQSSCFRYTRGLCRLVFRKRSVVHDLTDLWRFKVKCCGRNLPRTATDAEVNRLQQVRRTGGDHVTAAVDVHDVVLETDTNEESGRQIPEQVAHKCLVVTVFDDDRVWSEAAYLLWVADRVGSQAGNGERAIAVKQLRQALTEERVAVED